MQHRVVHDLGRETAKRVAVAAFESYREKFAKYSPEARWIDEDNCEISFTVKGKTLRGHMAVRPADIGLDLEVPFLFRPFRGKAISIIEREIRVWIEKAKNGEV